MLPHTSAIHSPPTGWVYESINTIHPMGNHVSAHISTERQGPYPSFKTEKTLSFFSVVQKRKHLISFSIIISLIFLLEKVTDTGCVLISGEPIFISMFSDKHCKELLVFAHHPCSFDIKCVLDCI